MWQVYLFLANERQLNERHEADSAACRPGRASAAGGMRADSGAQRIVTKPS